MWIVILIIALLLVIAGGAASVFIYASNKFLKNMRKNQGLFSMPRIDISFYENGPLKAAVDKGLAYMKTMPHEDIKITSHDGITLCGTCYPAPSGGGRFIIGMHGFKSSGMGGFAPYIRFYHSLGYGMILPDQRATGKSGGEYAGMGVLERLDCVDWANYAIAKYGEDVKLWFHGVSMGAAAVCCAAGEKLPPQVKGIISDCAFSSIWDEMEFQTRKIAGRPMPLIMKFCEWRCKRTAGYDFHSITALGQVKKARVPMLFVHGEKDSMVPVEMARLLYEACPSKKLLLTVPNANHAESYAVDPQKYQEAIKSLLQIK